MAEQEQESPMRIITKDLPNSAVHLRSPKLPQVNSDLGLQQEEERGNSQASPKHMH